MQRVVKVVTQEEFNAWAASQTPYYYQVINPAAKPIAELVVVEEVVMDSMVVDTIFETVAVEVH